MVEKKKVKKVKEAEIVEETADVVVTQKDEVSLPEKKQVDPTSLIAKAMDQGMDIEKMEQLFNLQIRWEQKEAKKAFDEAMASFQGECPVIEKTKEVRKSDGMLLYKYAPIDSIVKQVAPILSKYKLSYTFNPKLEDGVEVECIIKHVQGHSESSSMILPKSGAVGIKSAAQAVSGDVTFAKRMSFSNALGIMTSDEDIDGAKVDGDQDLDNNKALDIIAMFDSCATDEEVVTAWKSLTDAQRKNKEIILHVKEVRNAIANK